MNSGEKDKVRFMIGYFEKQGQWFFGCDSPAIRCKPPVEAGCYPLGLLPTGLYLIAFYTTFAPMLKRLTAILLLVTLISSNFSLFMVYAGFQINQKYIAETLCINKSRPWMHCNGKCYFMKKIHQAAENEKKQEAKDNLNRMEVSLFQEPFQLAFIEPTILETVKSSFPAYTYQYSSRYIEVIFRPPKKQIA